MDDEKIIELFFERSEPLLSYIARIVRNLSLKIYRKKERPGETAAIPPL